MPVQTPTTFASAAASNGTGEGASGRSASGSVDWSRPRMNGSQTFRRPSQLNTTVGHQRDSSSAVQTPSSGVYVPPHMNSALGRGASGLDNRYSKEFMMDVFKAQSESSQKGSVSSLLTEGWAPGQASASGGGGGWGRRDENRDPNPGPDVCWDESGSTKPLGLINMTEDERELFSNSVNSTLKPPQPKEGVQPAGINGRKSSISQGTGSLSGRPGARRRDTSDSYSGNPLASPTFVRGGRDENPLASPPPSLIRRRTDVKDGIGGSERPRIDTSGETNSPFGSLRRTTTNPLSAGATGPASPWANEPPSAGGFGRMGSFGVLDQPGTPGEKKSGFGSVRGESRFLKDLRGKDSSEDVSKGREKAVPFGMDKVAEESNPPSQRQSRIGHRGETGAVGEGPEPHAGSAALGGDEPSPPQQHSFLPGLDRQQRRDDGSFLNFGDSADHPAFRERMQQREGPGPSGSFNEPMSPTDTNPYHSPDHERTSVDRRHDEDEESYQNLSQPKAGSFEPSDHGSRPSSTAPPRTLSGLGGFGSIGGGWSGAPGTTGPQAKSPLNDPFFGSLADIGSPGGPGAFGPGGMPGPNNFGSTRSKLGSLFPQSMQDQMRANEQRQDFFGSIGSANAPPRDSDSPAARSSRNILDDIFGTQDRSRNVPSTQSPFPGNEGPFGQPPQGPGQAFSTAIGSPAVQAPSQHAPGSFFGPTSESEQDHLPPAQQRTMVMPDRMRWIYRDPSGKTQGPFSGLEMHDWYKAGFFSPELQVKKLEDGDYEPLAQLIRRIGNSREPFLVPQIGIAHGSMVGQPPSSVAGGASAGAAGSGAGANSGTVQPPFAGSFPSFGTTLTADQQNALERRKQEEQYLMAQQKEFLQQKQQMMMKNPMQYPSGPFNVHPGQLHHHSSAHSLQSQPSFGSMGTPAGGYPGAPGPMPQGGMPGGFFDMQRMQQGVGPAGPMPQGMQPSREDEIAGSLERMNLSRPGHSPFNSMGPLMQPGSGQDGVNPVATMLQDRQRLQQEQYEASQRGQVQPQDPSQGLDRLQEFNNLRQDDAGLMAGVIGKPQYQQLQGMEEESGFQPDERENVQGLATFTEPELAEHQEMVSKTANLEDAPPPQSVWASVEKPGKQPLEFPEPSVSPLPAPAAQRASKPVAEALAIDSVSRSQTPSVETPSSSLAPWAKESNEAPKGPSLKEIQEAETRKAAQQEAIAAEARRQLAEQERQAAAAAPAPAPGLPSTASWAASNSSPVTPGGSAWAKPAPGKTTTSTKKTLAQIQKEEEARKNKAAAAAAAAASTASVANANIVAGKRYAELASKSSSSTSPGPVGNMPGGAWTTVGAGGKVKTPAGPTTTGSRTVSGPVPTTTTTTGPSSTVKKPAAPVRSNSVQSAPQQANEQVMQWIKSSLSKGLNAGINPEEMAKSLMQFPPDVEIISDTIYSASTTLDGRRLAEEFVRRRKLADKGIPVTDGSFGGGASTGNGGSNNNGGWSEVAKKSTTPVVKEEPGAAFKVVSKKKAGKR